MNWLSSGASQQMSIPDLTRRLLLSFTLTLTSWMVLSFGAWDLGDGTFESGSDFNALLVYDVDGDGKAEVITRPLKARRTVLA